MNKSARLLERFRGLPAGLWLFSRVVCFKAPYFGSISPVFTRLEAGFGEARVARRRKVQNHLGGMHAIAIANLCELVAGTTLEVSIPSTHRWIPRGMKINYLSMAKTSVTARAEVKPAAWPDAGDIVVHVEALDETGKAVVTADIEMYISRRK